MTSDILMGGQYEVHPMADEVTWAVVNSDTGRVRNEGLTLTQAVSLASELNEDLTEGL